MSDSPLSEDKIIAAENSLSASRRELAAEIRRLHKIIERLERNTENVLSAEATREILKELHHPKPVNKELSAQVKALKEALAKKKFPDQPENS